MYFEDMTPYGYKLPFLLRDVFNVGWLDSNYSFKTCTPNKIFTSSLKAIMELKDESMDVHANLVRGIHPCNICGNDEVFIYRNNRHFPLGMSEIWIPFQNQWLVAPSMILHCIEEHCYEPPSEFIDAIQNFDTKKPYKAQDIYDKFIAEMM